MQSDTLVLMTPQCIMTSQLRRLDHFVVSILGTYAC